MIRKRFFHSLLCFYSVLFLISDLGKQDALEIM